MIEIDLYDPPLKDQLAVYEHSKLGQATWFEAYGDFFKKTATVHFCPNTD